MLKFIAIMILVIAGIAAFLYAEAAEVPLSWDDDQQDYVRCHNCRAYILQSQGGHHKSCEVCPFYPDRETIREEEQIQGGT